MRNAAPLHPSDRHKFLQRLVELLYEQGEIGDGAVARAARTAQKQFFAPPTDTGYKASNERGFRVERSEAMIRGASLRTAERVALLLVSSSVNREGSRRSCIEPTSQRSFCQFGSLSPGH
jgi:hypothetical protein